MSLRSKYRHVATRHGGLLLAGSASLLSGMAMSVIAAHFLAQHPPRAPATIAVLPENPPPAEIAPEEQPAPIAAPAPLPSSVPPAEASPAESAAASPAKPAWQAFALPARFGKARIAVIIDDMGLDRRRSAQIVDLPGPLTISYMTYAERLAMQTAEAHAHGHELMMHMPMQPLSLSMDAGADVLTDQLPPAELRRRIEADLGRFQGYVGVNNHMGSRFTANGPGMDIVMEELHRHGLLFIDSMTTGKSVGLVAARRAEVPAAARDVFIDDVDDQASIAAQLALVERQARKNGTAIAIGHPRDKTIAALSAWLPGLADKGLTLVPVTAVVKARQSGER